MNTDAEWITKRWGYSKLIHQDQHVSVELASGLKGGASSSHKHPHVANLFLCLSGVVDLYVGDDHFWRRLVKGVGADVKAGTWHRMYFVTDAELLELYSPEGEALLRMNDPALERIVRADTGWEPGNAPPGWPKRE